MAGTRERLMFDLFRYTGLRRGDAAQLGKQHIREGAIVLDTQKTGTRVTIPILPELQRTLDASPIGDLQFIGLTKEGLGNLFRQACDAAGVSKSAHGLRKYAAARLATAGATVHELQALFGWTDTKMASFYTRSADRQRLSKSGMDKLRTSIPSPGGKVRDSE
jgi:integrase